jgi:tRNA(fMet)-specific endonuclease VapC
LLDTNVVSFLFKGDTRAAAYAPLLQGNRLAISFMTVAELFEWAAVRNWGNHRLTRLEQALTLYLVIPVDVELCRVGGHSGHDNKRQGKPLPPKMHGSPPPHFAMGSPS